MKLFKLGHAVLLNNLAMKIPETVADVETLRSTLETIGFRVECRNNLNFKVKCTVYIILPFGNTHSQTYSLAVAGSGTQTQLVILIPTTYIVHAKVMFSGRKVHEELALFATR